MLSAAMRIYRHQLVLPFVFVPFCYYAIVSLRDTWLARNKCMTGLFFFCCVACFGVCSTAGCWLSRQLASRWLSYIFCYFFVALGHDICVNSIPDGHVALPSLVFFNVTSTSTRTRRGFFDTIKHSCLWSIITFGHNCQLHIFMWYVFCITSCTCFRLCFALPMQQLFAFIAVQASSLRVAFSASA